jgi:hypothetical protein
MVLLQQLGLHREFACIEKFLQILEHAFPNARDCEDLFGVGDDVSELMRVILDGLGSVAVRTDAKGILSVDLQQVSGLKQDIGDCFVIHALKINQTATGSRVDTATLAGRELIASTLLEWDWREHPTRAEQSIGALAWSY